MTVQKYNNGHFNYISLVLSKVSGGDLWWTKNSMYKFHTVGYISDNYSKFYIWLLWKTMLWVYFNTSNFNL